MENFWNASAGQYGGGNGSDVDTSNDDLGENTEQTEVAKGSEDEAEENSKIDTVTPGRENLFSASPDDDDDNWDKDDTDTDSDDDTVSDDDGDDELIPIESDDDEMDDEDMGDDDLSDDDLSDDTDDDTDDDIDPIADRPTTFSSTGDFSHHDSHGRTTGTLTDHEPGLNGPRGGRQ